MVYSMFNILKGIAVCIMVVLIVVVLMMSMIDNPMTPTQDGDTAVYMVLEE